MTATMERMLPLYEAKMLDAYDHRDADVYKSATATKRQNQPRYLTDDEKRDPSREVVPLYWVREDVVPSGLPSWLTGFSNVTSASNERTMLSAAFPKAGVGHSYPLYFATPHGVLLAVFNSFAFDYLTRLKVAGNNFSYFYLRQLPVPTPETLEQQCPWSSGTLTAWLAERVARLSCTSWSMAPMAMDLTGQAQVFPWNPDKRALIRAEIDAAMFHVYGVERDDVDYIMDTFRGVKEHDEATHGEYRTKRIILEIYDKMQEAIDSGVPYQPIVDLRPLEVSPNESLHP
jgi:hypothetical protein